MAKFVWSETLKCMVDKADGNPMVTNKESWRPEAPVFVPDIGEFKSPIDGSLISSRSSLKAHEKKHGVVQIGNDHPMTMEKAIKKHEEGKAYARQYAGWMDPK